MRTKRTQRLALAALMALGLGCNVSDPNNPLLSLFDLRAETFQRVYSLGGPENRTDEIMGLLNRTMLSAQRTLYCSFEDVNMPWVIQALLFHKNRGIDVKVGIDQDNVGGIGHNQLAAFLDSNSASAGQRLFVGNGGTGQVYLNTCVADEVRVWVSSIAPTLPGAYQMAGFGYYIQSGDDGVARKFTVEMDLITHGSFGSAKQRLNRRNHWLVGDLDVGVYMAPAESPLANFVSPRLQTARQSVVVYGSEFIANKLQSSSSTEGKIRQTGDIAYDLSFGPAAFKQATSNWWTYVSDDPEEKNGLNSMNYLRGRGNVDLHVRAGDFPSNGFNIVLLDNPAAAFDLAKRTQNYPMALIMSHPLSTRADSSHDGAMFVFENAAIIDEITQFYNQLRQRSVRESTITTTGQTIATANQREVVISELNWMGGYSNTGSSSTARDYVELYNNTNAPMNISRWRVQCTAAGAWANDCTLASPASCMAILPDRTLIGPGQYFVISRSGNTVIQKASLVLPNGAPSPATECDAGDAGTCLGRLTSITTTFDQCRLTDASGTVVDTIGVSGTTFSSNSNLYGLNDTSALNRRSMERKNLTTDGTVASNWHTNANVPVGNYNIRADYHLRTFGTPGYANSPDGLALQSAASTSLTTVNAVFSSNPETGGATNAANYCIGLGTDTTTCSNVLAVQSASVNGTTVTLTTATQTKGASYKLFVSNVTSQLGAALLVTNATFTGFFNQATMVINEVAPSQTSSLDLIELYVTAGGSTLNYTLVEGSGSNLLTFPDLEVATGDYIVVHINASGTNETSSKTQSSDTGHYPAAWDLWSSDGGLTGTDNVISLRNSADVVVDALIFGNNNASWTGSGESNAVSVGQWTQAGGSWAESDSVNVTTANGTSYQQTVNGSTNNNVNTAWQVAAESIGRANGSPGVTPSPAVGATGVAVATNIVLTFTEAMNTGVGTVTVTGSTSGTQASLACTWTVGNTVCTIDPPTDFNTAETVTVTLNGFQDAGDSLGPPLTSYTFGTVNPALVPTVTNVVVASTLPNNGTTPYNTGTATLTITGTNFQAGGGVTCPTGVRLNNTNGSGTAVNTQATTCTVNSDTQITATFPAFIKPNPVTGWDVIVTNGTGSNTTSTVTFKPVAGLLISEVLLRTTANAAHEFVEIYNPTGLAINICTVVGGGDVKLRRRTATGSDSALTLTTTNCTIPSHGFFLAIGSGATLIWTNYDATFSAALAANGIVYISSSANVDGVIDSVGWGTITDATLGCEGGNTMCTNLSSDDNSIERKPAGGAGHATDTNVNSSDFNAQSATTTPRGTADAAQP